MSDAKLLAEARGHLAEGNTVRLVLDSRNEPIDVDHLSAPDSSGLVTAESRGAINRIQFYPESLVDILPGKGRPDLYATGLQNT